MVGVSHTAIQKAISTGRIPKAALRFDAQKRAKIYDVELAKKSLIENTDPSRGGQKKVPTPTPEEDVEFEEASKKQADTYNKSRAVKEIYAARKAKLEYEVMAGQMVESYKVKVEAFNLARRVRDSILNIPSRMAAQLAAETDPHKVHVILEAELVRSLEEMVKIELEALEEPGGGKDAG